MDKVDIYVINLDKDTERLKTFEKNIYPHKFTRVKAIYGKEEDVTKYDDIFYSSKYLVPKNVVAAGLSHRKALKTFIETSNKDYAIICEDDAIPSDITNINEDVNEIFETAPKDWDMIKLDFWYFYGNENNYNQNKSLLLTSYLISKKGAENFLKNKIVYYPDTDPNFYDNVNIYNNRKKIFYQDWDNNDSSVHTSGNNYNPLSHISNKYNFKAIRICDNDIILSDLLLILILLIVLIILRKYLAYFNIYITKMMKYVTSSKLN
jgi:GR25 family glycosyltransferase involved in LPS biosynthesis